MRGHSFGELWAGGRPHDLEYVFASIQGLRASGLLDLEPDHFNAVIVHEFHHATARSYQALDRAMGPATARTATLSTPERRRSTR